MTKKEINKLIKRASELMKQKEEIAAPIYKELGEVTELLAQVDFESANTTTGTLLLVDNFSEKTTMYKPVFVNRYELKMQKKKGA